MLCRNSMNEINQCPRWLPAETEIVGAARLAVRRVRHVRRGTRIPLLRSGIVVVARVGRLQVQVRRVRDVSRALKLFGLHLFVQLVLGGLPVVIVGVGGVCRKSLAFGLKVDQRIVVVVAAAVVVPVVELFQIVPELVEVDSGRGCHFPGQNWLHLSTVVSDWKVVEKSGRTDDKVFLELLTHCCCCCC